MTRISNPLAVFAGVLWKALNRSSVLRGLGMWFSVLGGALTQNEDWLLQSRPRSVGILKDKCSDVKQEGKL